MHNNESSNSWKADLGSNFHISSYNSSGPYIACIHVCTTAAACVSCQDLRSTLREGNRACSGEEVTFTCTVRGPSSLSVISLAWSSTEYIGQGGSLQFSTANMIGAVENSTMDGNITATATVTNNTNVDGELILESTLRITAVEASTVICLSSADGGSETIELSISGMYLYISDISVN